MKQYLMGLVALFLAVSCSPEAQPINYGSDQCDFCRMTIVDKAHAAEVVTKKGRAYKFDSGECMIQFVQQNQSEAALMLITDFDQPGNLINASKAIFLISPNIPSPMGANLSAFASKEKATEIQQEKGGDLYNWQEVQERLKK